MCRQALREFLDLSAPIFMFYGEGDGGCVVKTMGEVSLVWWEEWIKGVFAGANV